MRRIVLTLGSLSFVALQLDATNAATGQIQRASLPNAVTTPSPEMKAMRRRKG